MSGFGSFAGVMHPVQVGRDSVRGQEAQDAFLAILGQVLRRAETGDEDAAPACWQLGPFKFVGR